MKIALPTALLALLSSCGTAPVAPIAPVLFNGHDLSGWHADVPDADGNPDIAPSFVVRDGMLISQG